MSTQSNSYRFFTDVYEVVKLIPKGRVTTYGAIATYLGAKRSSRLVGYALNSAFTLKDIPAHRVVNRAGVLTGKIHFKPPTLMQKLLEQEGVKIKEDTVVDFKTVFWDPNLELAI
jgi:methylated-DNA-protein-cysteine methyltransferase-like protein